MGSAVNINPRSRLANRTRKNPRRRNSVPAALAVLKRTEALHYSRRGQPARSPHVVGAYRSGGRISKRRATKLQRLAQSRRRKPVYAGSPFPRGTRMSKVQLSRRVRRNPVRRAPSKSHIRLQEKRGAQWVTLAMFPNNPKGKGLCRTVGKRLHMKHPARTYRAVS